MAPPHHGRELMTFGKPISDHERMEIKQEDIERLRADLDRDGYGMIRVLTDEEIDTGKALMTEWQASIPDLAAYHAKWNPHMIYKRHRVGHSKFAWYTRLRPAVREVYGQLWNVEDPQRDMIVSFDGACHMGKDLSKKDKFWTHSDQAPKDKGLMCYQGFVSYTDNRERTLVVCQGSHLDHERVFGERASDPKQRSKAWQLVPTEQVLEYEEAETRKALHVPAGYLVLWDSRTFHQNRYGAPGSEERLVQYVCMLPRSTPSNTPAQARKRRQYFEQQRTTSHWPAPLRVNPLQAQSYGDPTAEIDYGTLPLNDLTQFGDEIDKLL